MNRLESRRTRLAFGIVESFGLMIACLATGVAATCAMVQILQNQVHHLHGRVKSSRPQKPCFDGRD